MSTHYIYTKDGVKHMRPVHTREEYMALRDSSEQKQTVAAIRSGNEGLKHRLEQMNYSCLPNDDGTLKGSTRMSNTVGMDIDHLSPEEMPAVRDRILAKKDELGLKMLEESARGWGYHLVFARRPDLSQEENLKWASDLLGVKFDDKAKDITRVFFTTTEAELLYLDDSIFEINLGTDYTDFHGLNNNPSANPAEDKEKIRVNPCNQCQKEFKGIAYADIIAEFWRRTGGVPTEGERNKRLHQLAANLRSISDSSSRPTTGNIGK